MSNTPCFLEGLLRPDVTLRIGHKRDEKLDTRSYCLDISDIASKIGESLTNRFAIVFFVTAGPAGRLRPRALTRWFLCSISRCIAVAVGYSSSKYINIVTDCIVPTGRCLYQTDPKWHSR